jgi:hypothetical protein
MVGGTCFVLLRMKDTKTQSLTIDGRTHLLLKKWCNKTGMKVGAVASQFIQTGIKNKVIITRDV